MKQEDKIAISLSSGRYSTRNGKVYSYIGGSEKEIKPTIMRNGMAQYNLAYQPKQYVKAYLGAIMKVAGVSVDVDSKKALKVLRSAQKRVSPEIAEEIKEMVARGLSINSISKKLDLAYSTAHLWCNKYID